MRAVERTTCWLPAPHVACRAPRLPAPQDCRAPKPSCNFPSFFGVAVKCLDKVLDVLLQENPTSSRSKNNYRGPGGVVCVFHVFRGYRPAKTTIIIWVWGRGRQRRRGQFSMFFKGAENGPGRASNGRFGPPFWMLKGGDTKSGNGVDPASSKPLISSSGGPQK